MSRFGFYSRRCCLSSASLLLLSGIVGTLLAEIPQPKDAPLPLSPAESLNTFRVPEGFRMELVAAEPLIHEPSGVCWDARGRLYVSELHGYNLDGQYDIEELNKTGELDHVVRRIDAIPAAKAAAKAETFGTVKLLSDSDGDGVMDKSTVFADRLPACYGICPARDGIIAVGAPEIVFLADRDGDGHAEIREVLYTGFAEGNLERGINCPQWGFDDWIYVGAGHAGGTIIGPHLKKPLKLPNTDFRIKADGTAIEPITGRTLTIGFAFTESGERFVAHTIVPGILVAPLPWQYLSRNAEYAPNDLQVGLGGNRVYPTSQPHPWRTRRAEDPGFAKLYTDRYGVAESAPNGYFTSVCSPLVYQDHALPGLAGQLFACEPAQNLIHRAIINRSETELRLDRAPGEEQSEFLTSTDPWFHPIALSHGPDGSIYIADFYREIIEDYSAIPRYLQQQYELVHGKDHGRIWRLTHQDAPRPQSADMSRLTANQLVSELASDNFWRRQTARRLLTEGKKDVAPAMVQNISNAKSPSAAINTLYTLSALDAVTPETLTIALRSKHANVRLHALRLAEPWLDRDQQVIDHALALVDDEDAAVVLQLALSLGESADPRVISTLVKIARNHGSLRWMDAAVMTSLSGRAGDMLRELVKEPDQLADARRLLAPLASAIAARRDLTELSDTMVLLTQIEDLAIRQTCWEGLRSAFSGPTQVSLTDHAVLALKATAAHEDSQLAAAGQSLIQLLRVETEEDRALRIEQALNAISNIQTPVEVRLAAVSEVAAEQDAQVTDSLLAAVGNSTPQVREAILNAVFSRQERLASVLAAIESKTLPASALSGVQRASLLDHRDAKLRERASQQFATLDANHEQALAHYAAALHGERNAARGAQLFRQKCGTCHQAHGVGVAVGPDLSAESKRAEETILRDIIAPSSSITAGYVTYSVSTTEGQVFTGLLAAESASSVTLKLPEGKVKTVLRKEIEEIKASSASMMPEDLIKTLSPQEVADILAWLRAPDAHAVTTARSANDKPPGK